MPSSSFCTRAASASGRQQSFVTSIAVIRRSSRSTLARAVWYSGGSGRSPSFSHVPGPPGNTITCGPAHATIGPATFSMLRQASTGSGASTPITETSTFLRSARL